MGDVIDLKSAALRSVKSYPVKSGAVLRTLVSVDVCPECGGELDTGWECNGCGYDAQPIAITMPEAAWN